MQSTLPGFISGFATRKWYTNRYETIQLSSASDKHARKRGNNITRRRCIHTNRKHLTGNIQN